MRSVVDPIARDPATPVVAGLFVLLATVAWFASPGISVALACYGAALTSTLLYRLSPAAASRQRRCAALLGLALTWFCALAYCAVVLPSNFGAAVI